MKRKILIIDDSMPVRKFIEKSLGGHSGNFEFAMAKDGSEGLNLAHADPPDLILLDYVLPDMRGDEICNSLLLNPRTAKVPVILLSSSSEETKLAQASLRNAAHAIAKPFTPELLTATVGYVFKSLPSPLPTASPALEDESHLPSVKILARSVSFRGHTGFFSLTDVLLTIEKDRLTGVLRSMLGRIAVETYARNGQIQLVTTRDSALYLKDSTFEFISSKGNVWATCEKGQRDSGCPLFILMTERNLLATQMTLPLVEIHGHRLFSRLWTAGEVAFEFEDLRILPNFVAPLPPTRERMGIWLLKTTRYVGDSCMTCQNWGDLRGVPGFTRHGYDDIQQLTLNSEESLFVSLVNGVNSVHDIALEMNIPIENAVQILFRFTCLRIMEYWPSSTLEAS